MRDATFPESSGYGLISTFDCPARGGEREGEREREREREKAREREREV